MRFLQDILSQPWLIWMQLMAAYGRQLVFVESRSPCAEKPRRIFESYQFFSGDRIKCVYMRFCGVRITVTMRVMSVTAKSWDMSRSCPECSGHAMTSWYICMLHIQWSCYVVLQVNYLLLWNVLTGAWGFSVLGWFWFSSIGIGLIGISVLYFITCPKLMTRWFHEPLFSWKV